MYRILKASVQAILERPLGFDWTVQGLGMLRLYLPGKDNLRLHIWDSRLSFPNVSTIHTHPWYFESYVLAGVIRNKRWTEGEGQPYLKSEIRCGEGGCLLGSPTPVKLHSRPEEVWKAGDTYRQYADEIHSSSPEDGTISVIERVVEEGHSVDSAYVYYPMGTEWISAEPRPATESEVIMVTSSSIKRWFDG